MKLRRASDAIIAGIILVITTFAMVTTPIGRNYARGETSWRANGRGLVYMVLRLTGVETRLEGVAAATCGATAASYKPPLNRNGEAADLPPLCLKLNCAPV
jgi:hypothetical protein